MSLSPDSKSCLTGSYDNKFHIIDLENETNL